MDARVPVVIYISSEEEEEDSTESDTASGDGGEGGAETSDDSDCVILEEDPFKPNEELSERASDDSDDVLVTGVKGQAVVACRDYPHPRHLCVKFPFDTTSREIHCDQCHCYVCETLAPCVYWRSEETLSHCHATDKIKHWKTLRETKKNEIVLRLNNLNLGDSKSQPS
ncbi:hypothetical protein DM860_012350 [Cuscuta australis]|uniref:Uncharacterized protein n=1 Tax=Cuscuta australis TaxID=267555 RepID=A0A328DPY9_9ASTE|nr:hypothetical protein DM860_012350 [Cuscuta australis]